MTDTTARANGGVALALSASQRRALEALCDTFAPGEDGLPSATQLGVPDALLTTLSKAREAEQRDFVRLLGVWDSHLLTLLGGGGPARFSSLPQERRERILRSWCDSRLGPRRAVFQALRQGVLHHYYVLPGPGEGRNPVWDRIGYPGPLGLPDDPPPKRLRPLPVEADMQLDCDVCIVGSGAGGGTAAGVLAAAGLDVVVLETGDYYDDEDFDGGEWSGYSRMYMNGGGIASKDGSIGMVAGSCLGGGTVINYSTSFPTPDEVRQEWADLGAEELAGEAYDTSMSAVNERLSVNQEHNRLGFRDAAMHRALTELGWHSDRMPRNVSTRCDQGENCGYCGYGCRLGAKQSVAKTWLQDASDAGARIVCGVKADRVVLEQGAARGVEARGRGGERVAVRARAVVASCGALHTPALLKRSGLKNPNIGRHLTFHPVTMVWGVYDEIAKPWEGVLQGNYSDQFRFLDGNYGVKVETASLHPSFLVFFAPWRSATQHLQTMEQFPNAVPFAIVLRDRDGGQVDVDKDGEPVVSYSMSDFDLGHVRTGFEAVARMHEVAGARRIFSSHARPNEYQPGSGTREDLLRGADAIGWGAGRCSFASYHLMGSARMTGSAETGACNPMGETWEARDLVVCDGSTFPTCSGVNPMISIESVAHLNATRLAERLA